MVCKTYRPFGPLAYHSPPNELGRQLKVDAGVWAFDPHSKRHLRIGLAPQESDVRPRSRAVTASHQGDFFHVLDPQAKLSGKGEPAANMLHYPPPKISPRESVFAPRRYGQGRYRCSSGP